jgi:hypothetical protein
MSKNVMKNVWDSKKKEQERLDKVKAKEMPFCPKQKRLPEKRQKQVKAKSDKVRGHSFYVKECPRYMLQNSTTRLATQNG